MHAHVLLPSGLYATTEIVSPIYFDANKGENKLKVEYSYEYRSRIFNSFDDDESPKANNRWMEVREEEPDSRLPRLHLVNVDLTQPSSIFRESERRYNAERILDYIFYPTEHKTRLHFFGDIFQYNIHWMNHNELKSFMRDKFNTTIKSRKNKTNFIGKDFVKYICLKDHLPKNGSGINKIDGWDLVPDFPTKDGLKFGGDERILCAGCTVGANIVNQYLMTAIDVCSNSVVVFDMNLDIIHQIKNAYKNSDEKYDSIDQWFYDNDLIISSTGKGYSKKNIVEVVPSTYHNLDGEIYIPNRDYINLKLAETSIVRNHAYNGSYFSEMIDQKNIPIGDICSININEGLVNFMNASKKDIYKTYNIKKADIMKVKLKNSKLNMLEI